jgi:cytosine/uracil/thiamine/allantoin permease
MYLSLPDIVLLLHPILAVTLLFPVLGIVVSRAWETRRRRLDSSETSKIPASVGSEHVKLGQFLTAVVVGIAMLGMTRSILSTIVTDQVWSKAPFQVIFIALIYAATLASLVLLYKARQRIWRAVFATLTGMGLVILGFQNGVFRRDDEWYVSHFYFGITAALLMIFALAIVQDIYRDRTNTWRKIHIALNVIALLLFVAQGITGTRDLLEIPLDWQKSAVYSCNFDPKSPGFKTCPAPPANK